MQRKEESRKLRGWIWRWKLTAAVSSRTRLCVRARHWPVSNVAGGCQEMVAIIPDGGVVVEENCPWWRRA